MAVKTHKNHAIVHTATVDVRILRLAKKQMTLSVFRQLQEECIFPTKADRTVADGFIDWSLRGVPWGIVNYTWSSNTPWTDYHLVWQLEEDLRRMPLPLVEHLERKRYMEQCDHIWGCPRCKQTFNHSVDTCDYCHKRCREFKGEEPRQYGDGFFEWLGIWDSWDQRSGKYDKECQKDYAGFVSQLKSFEQLDQLFIAI